VSELLLKEFGITELYSSSPESYFKKANKPDNEQIITVKIQKNNINPENITELESPEVMARNIRKMAEDCKSIEQLRDLVVNFKSLSICKTAKNTVFSDGNPNSKIMVIGEAPGANEDEEGIPFCGMSGKLLDKMLETIGLDRQKNFYITNSIFWRPPGNRRPTPEETNICLPLIERHIALFNPKLIILVGSTAALSLLHSIDPISRLRQNFHSYTNKYLKEEVPVAVIFHPSYLLRQPKQKKTTWYDLLNIKEKFSSLII